ncbi:MAG: DUF924 family protein [Candidimonas sp.]|nr:DUF924 family protein [Candidimonas sp.]
MKSVPDQRALAVIDFWQSAGPSAWFAKNDDFDARFRDQFMDLHFAAARRELDHWSENAQGSLALILLLDQFPRNAFRDTPHMFATDGLARRAAKLAIDANFVTQVGQPLALFLCVPFIHSEDIADQRYGVQLYQRYSPDNIRHAIEHCEIIARFGRFPHRNRILARDCTAEELQFLEEGGFAG